MSSKEESKIKQATPKSGLETGSLARPSDSNIKQAQPKQGLETGELVSGKAKVAMEYAKSLSGAEGPEAMFDAVDEIAAKRAEQAINRLSFAGRGGAAIFGANGSFSVVSRQATPEVGSQFEGLPDPGPWDIISDPNSEGESKLSSPFCVWSYAELDKTVSITNTSFEIGLNKWIVAKASGPIATFLETPELEIDIVDEWNWYPNAHQFTDDEPYEWIESYLPIWKLVGENERTSSMVKVGAEGEYAIYGQKYIYGTPRLAMHLSVANDQNRLRLVPEFF
jgi:hypothetical protein